MICHLLLCALFGNHVNLEKDADQLFTKLAGLLAGLSIASRGFLTNGCPTRRVASMSQLLLRIDQELRTEENIVRRAELLAKRSGLLARMGRFDEAKQIIAELHQVFGHGRSCRATAWKMLAEGTVQLFESLSPEALDRFTRAQLLGKAMNDRQVVAIASAWKAHIQFEFSDFEAMAQSIAVTIENVNDKDHDTLARLSMVLCDVFLFCGDLQRGQLWFLRGRDHALNDGDQASMEALLHNRATLTVARLRVQSCIGEIGREEIPLARLEVNSARNLQELIRAVALSNLMLLCDAHLLILEARYETAICRLESIRETGPFSENNFSQSFIDLEVAYCLFKLGQVEKSLIVFNQVRDLMFESLDIDEQLVLRWMRYQMAIADSRYGDAVSEKVVLDEISVQYLALIERIRGYIFPFASLQDVC